MATSPGGGRGSNAVRGLGETARAFKRTRRLAQLQGRCGGVRGGPLEEHLVPSTSAAPAIAAPAATVAVSVAIAEGQIIGIMRRLGATSGPDPITTTYDDFANWFNLPPSGYDVTA